MSTCPVCNHKGEELGENWYWQCSHVECPNRKPLTAAGGSEGLQQIRLFEEAKEQE